MNINTINKSIKNIIHINLIFDILLERISHSYFTMICQCELRIIDFPPMVENLQNNNYPFKNYLGFGFARRTVGLLVGALLLVAILFGDAGLETVFEISFCGVDSIVFLGEGVL
jgi:hypothetical protein